MNNIIIKKAAIDDMNKIWELGSNVNEFQVSDEVATFWPKEILEKCITDGSIFVAKDEGVIVGFVISNYNPIFKKAIIENIFVDPGFRGKGVAKKLLASLLSNLRTKGCGYACALIEKTDISGINFYIKNGFNKGINCVWMDQILKSNFKKNT